MSVVRTLRDDVVLIVGAGVSGTTTVDEETVIASTEYPMISVHIEGGEGPERFIGDADFSESIRTLNFRFDIYQQDSNGSDCAAYLDDKMEEIENAIYADMLVGGTLQANAQFVDATYAGHEYSYQWESGDVTGRLSLNMVIEYLKG